MNFSFNSTYLAVVVVPGRILVDLGFLVLAGRVAVPVPPTKPPWSNVFVELAVVCETECGMVADVVSSDANNGGPLLAAETSVSETEFGSISWLCVLVTNGGLPLLATLAETSLFSVSKTEFGSISWLGTCISSERFSDEC